MREEIGDLGLQPDLLPGALRHVPADAMKRTRQDYRAYVAERVEHGGWSERDVEDYRVEVGRIMERGTADEQAAARTTACTDSAGSGW